MPKTSFDNKFDNKDKPVTLYCIISPDNPKQQGDNFLEFVRLVNEQPPGDIAKVILVDASYLRRHYDFKYSDSENQKSLFEWREANNCFIGQMQVPCEVISWFQLIKDKRYEEIHNRIKTSFAEGEDDFRAKVESVANQFIYKGTIKQTTLYLLEECAVALLLGEYLTYPGELNEAIQYAMKQSHMGPKFISYTLGRNHAPKSLPNGRPPIGRTSPTEKRNLYSNYTFFNGEKEASSQYFPEQMSFRKKNHVWSAECEIQFIAECKNIAIQTLLTNIEEAKKDYEERKDELSHPIVLEYKRQFTGYMISYRIELRNGDISLETKPFDKLTCAVKTESGLLEDEKQLKSNYDEQASQTKKRA